MARSWAARRGRSQRCGRNASAGGDDAGKLSISEILPRISVAVLVSTVGSTLTAGFALFGMKSLGDMGIALGRAASQSVLIGVFALSFIAMFIPSFRKMKFGANKAAAAPAPAPRPAPMVAPTLPSEPEPEPEPEPEKEEAEPDDGGRSASDPKRAKDANAWLTRFSRHSLAPIASSLRALDPFNRFGLTLFMAGAGEYVGTRFGVDREQVLGLLINHVQSLGHTAETALGFCANMEEYLLQPKYLVMYDKGRSAMRRHLVNQEADAGIQQALERWNNPGDEEKSAQNEFVVVLFTDIVDSTRQTQEIGDQGAMEVVRAHNTIIRQALTMHNGQEVKHMGDGIMAVFSSIASSIEAAIQMQEGISGHNSVDTNDREFHVRIGMNAGEPIREGGDFFGTPVQLAARVMSKAGADEITVSHTMHELYNGRELNFQSMGGIELKGFQEPVEIFMIMWNPNASPLPPTAAAVAQATAPQADPAQAATAE